MTRRILISGASIAGCATAWWLVKQGNDVTVIEQAPAFRDGGQNVDVRGAAREVVQAMGLEEAIKGSNTGERGLAWVDEANRTIAQFDLSSFEGDGPTAELEILRGDLARILYDATSPQADFRFDERIATITRSTDGASVTFTSGKEERFDLVIIAEGVGSRTRELVFPGENDVRWMGLATAFFTIPRAPSDSATARLYNMVGGRNAGVRPDNRGTTRAFFNVQGRDHLAISSDTAKQKAFVRTSFAGEGWEVPRLLAGMDAADDFWFDDLRQVRMKRWSADSVVLIGDAAWCVTPLGGVGASLALIGAYVLAGELATADVATALNAYERLLRSLVLKSQAIPSFVPRLAHPHSRAGIAILRTVQRLAAIPIFTKLAAKTFTPAIQSFGLPCYSERIP